jgi:hypothetical protein
MKDEDRELAKQAAEYASKEMDRILKRAGLTQFKVVKPIVEALQAENSEGNPDHRVRLDAAKLGIVLLDMKPPEKVEHSGNINVTHELATRIRQARERAKSGK